MFVDVMSVEQLRSLNQGIVCRSMRTTIRPQNQSATAATPAQSHPWAHHHQALQQLGQA
jgi:hypothetical protein